MAAVEAFVLGNADDALAVAASAAAEAATTSDQRAALLITLTATPRRQLHWPLPAFPAAARCRDELADDGVVATARGRLVRVELSGGDALRRTEQLIAAARVPVVVLSLLARDDELDRLICSSTRVLIAASADRQIDELSRSELLGLGTSAEIVERPPPSAGWSVATGIAWSRVASNDGQATVELLTVVPVLLAVTLAAAQLLAAGLCRELAGQAAGAGAEALLQGREPLAAARESLPGWSHSELRVTRRGRAIRVQISPPSLIPGLARLLSVEGRADAGPPV